MNTTVNPANASMLIVGGPSTGKTTFILQLFGRLRRDIGTLKLRNSPDTFAHLENAMERLNNGLEVEHTSLTAYDELCLPLQMPDGTTCDLVWPDYGGEQISAMIDERRISSDWEARVLAADGWLLFLRPDRISDAADIIHRPLEELLSPPTAAPSTPVQWSDQARTIELLQLLLCARRADILNRLSKPAIGVVLSCWDELGIGSEGRQPNDVFREKMPLLVDLLEANWRSEARFTVGISSTERALNDKKPDEEFVQNGPEKYGFVITPSGERNPDLSLPLMELIRRSV
jgi:GTPase SAR1 family protein